jgi:hypothetical protein
MFASFIRVQLFVVVKELNEYNSKGKQNKSTIYSYESKKEVHSFIL